MTSTKSAVELAWERQSVWSQAADRLRSGPARARTAALVLAISAAILALLGSQLLPVSEPAGRTLSFAAAAAAGAVGVLRGFAGPDRVGEWVQARSVSETLKTEVFLYLMRCEPYADENREARLDAEVERLESQADNLVIHTSGIEPKARTLPEVFDLESYLDRRLTPQITSFYEPKAARMAARAMTFRRGEVALAVLAAVLTAAAGTFSWGAVGAWVPVVTTIATVLAAHAAAERYEFLALEYSRTANELRRLRDRRSWHGRPAPSAQELVARCEEIISVQNDKWMVRWSGSEPSGDHASPTTPADGGPPE